MKQLKNFLIKREQSQACLSFAKREKSRLLAKTLLTLVALLAVTTGAYATEFTSLKVGDVLHVGDVINTSTNYKVLGGDLDANFQPATLVRGNIGTFDITESETGAYYLLKIKNGSFFGTIMSPMGYDGGYWPVTATSDGISVTAITPGDYTELTFAVHEGTSATPVPLTWDATAQTATLTNGMPAGNVTASVEYFPQAEFAKSTDATLAPTAIADVPANTDAPIVTAGTVANIGTSEVPQGTLMYFVSQSTDNTDPVAPDYDTEGWSENVPTANGLQQGNAYVWYYIKGAEPANIADRSDDNTRSDSDIKPLGTTGFVTLAPEPTYNVEFAEGTNPETPAEPEWTATPNTGVKKGTEVTVTYTGTRKVIGVKAEKKSAAVMTTVTWNSTNVFNSAHEDVVLSKWYPTPLTYEGITISFSGTKPSSFKAYDEDDYVGSLTCYGNHDDSFTFTAPSGKKFCKIEIINNGYIVFTNYGDWTRDADNKIVWSGTAATAVTLGSVYTDADNLNSIVFYLSE